MMPNAPYVTGYWGGTGVSANIPGVGTPVPLLVNTNSLPFGTPSQELILNPNSIPGGLYKSDHRPITHGGVFIYVEVKTDASGMTVTLDDYIP